MLTKELKNAMLVAMKKQATKNARREKNRVCNLLVYKLKDYVDAEMSHGLCCFIQHHTFKKVYDKFMIEPSEQGSLLCEFNDWWDDQHPYVSQDAKIKEYGFHRDFTGGCYWWKASDKVGFATNQRRLFLNLLIRQTR